MSRIKVMPLGWFLRLSLPALLVFFGQAICSRATQRRRNPRWLKAAATCV